MRPIEIVVIILAVALVGFTVVFNLIRRRRGKSSCCCDCGAKPKRDGDCRKRGGCGGCPYASSCHPVGDERPEKREEDTSANFFPTDGKG